MALFALAAPASAQQVFIKSLYIASRGANRCGPDAKFPQRICCPGPPTARCPNDGNISNDPRIEFSIAPSNYCYTLTNSPFLPPGDSPNNICNADIFLCAQAGWSNITADLALDFIKFEIFKFKDGTNPLDESGSAAPVRTFFVDDPGLIKAGTTSESTTATCGDPNNSMPPTCVLWDGSTNLDGEFGKANGQYGFRATIETNMVGASGNIKITQTRPYPSGATVNATCNAETGLVEQKPITIDVTDVHMFKSTPTVVGDFSGVSAEPYNLTYRLAKDATMYITIHNTQNQYATGGVNPVVRTVLAGQPRVGEGTPNGKLFNGDSWNGRFDNGDLAPPGVYLATLQAVAYDQYGKDLSIPVTRQVGLDTLQYTDIRVQPLMDLSTSLAILGYMLTEPATTYVDIYPPGTQFAPITVCARGWPTISPLNDINNPCQDQSPGGANRGVPKNFNPMLLNGTPAPLLRHIEEVKDYRRAVTTIWDGRDYNGNMLPDGDYVFVLYGALPSQNGYAFNDQSNDKRIWSTNARSGFITIARGMVTISQIGPSTSVVGSSPSVAGLDPFIFSYTLSRDANVSMKVFKADGTTLVKTLVDNESRIGSQFLNRERWGLPTDDRGLWIASGTYIVQLTAADAFFPAKVSTMTAIFPVDLFRITDIMTSALLTGSTDVVTLNYQLTQTMLTAWNIYPPGTVVSASTRTWPPCESLEPGGGCAQVTSGPPNYQPVAPVHTVKGLRPGRLRITEYWDGHDRNGLFVQDGNYVFTLAAQSTTTPRYFATDRIIGNIIVARGYIVFPVFNVTPTIPHLFNSSQTISLPPYEIEYSLTRPSSVTVHVLNTANPPTVVRELALGQVRDANILNREYWDGRDDGGNFVAPGFYTIQAVAEDLASQLSSGSTAQQTVSVNPLRIYDVAISPLSPYGAGAEIGGPAVISYQVSETMKVAIKIYKPGTSFDRNGNAFPPEWTSLVKRVVGVRAARSRIDDFWDGTDEKLTMVPDGNYIFKIMASTDMAAIDSLTGDLAAGAPLSEDLVIAEIPVVRGGSEDPPGEFNANTIIYPNPVSGDSATIQIYVPIEARVSMKIYTLAGELVFMRDFGIQAAGTCVGGCGVRQGYSWQKENVSGRKVAHGVYFVLLREEPVKGERIPMQTIRKVLIP
ncbi:MAG: hypothetical protein HY922_03015 [Elusimicrobia bacterium]|nr:hypothetical protein [Elusimicrobiota bacterium]